MSAHNCHHINLPPDIRSPAISRPPVPLDNDPATVDRTCTPKRIKQPHNSHEARDAPAAQPHHCHEQPPTENATHCLQHSHAFKTSPSIPGLITPMQQNFVKPSLSQHNRRKRKNPSLLLRRPNMRPMHLTPKQQTAPALLPMRLQRTEVQHHKRAAAFAVCCSAAEGRLEEVGQLSSRQRSYWGM